MEPENLIMGNNQNNFLLGTPITDRIIGKGGNDKGVGGEDNDELYGDFFEPLVLFINNDSNKVTKPEVKAGNDHLIGNDGDDTGTGDYGGNVEGAIEPNIIFDSNTEGKTVIAKFGDDAFYGGSGNDSFLGDANILQTLFLEGSSGNKAFFYYGDDCIDLGVNNYGLQQTVGDSAFVNTFIEGSQHNKIAHYFGNDHIFVGATFVPFVGNALNLAVNAPEEPIIDINVSSGFILGDFAVGNTIINGGSGSNINYTMGNDKIKIGKIKGEINILEAGDDRNVLGDDVEINVGVGIGIVSGDSINAATIIGTNLLSPEITSFDEVVEGQPNSENIISYHAGDDKISIAKAEGAVIVSGDVGGFAVQNDGQIFGAISTLIQSDGSGNQVNYYLGDDYIKLGKTVGGELSVPTVIFADAGQGGLVEEDFFSDQLFGFGEESDPIVVLNPVLISILGEGNTVVYHDGDDKINVAYGKKGHHLGKGDQVIYSDTVYKIQSPKSLTEGFDLLNDVQIIRGNDVMAGGKGADTFVFQILEMLNGEWLGPGKDIIKDFNPYEGDVLRFITESTDDGLSELTDSIAKIKVHKDNTYIKFDDGSRLKLVDFNEGSASTQTEITAYLDNLASQGALEIFGLDEPIPLGPDIIPV